MLPINFLLNQLYHWKEEHKYYNSTDLLFEIIKLFERYLSKEAKKLTIWEANSSDSWKHQTQELYTLIESKLNGKQYCRLIFCIVVRCSFLSLTFKKNSICTVPYYNLIPFSHAQLQLRTFFEWIKKFELQKLQLQYSTKQDEKRKSHVSYNLGLSYLKK